MLERLHADVAHHLEGDAVVHHVHQPLADGGDTHGNAKLDGNLAQGREVDIALAHNQVHAAARKNGGIQRGKNGNSGKQQGEQHQTAVRLDQL